MFYIDTSETCNGSSLATVIACLFSYRKLYVSYLLDIACVAQLELHCTCDDHMHNGLLHSYIAMCVRTLLDDVKLTACMFTMSKLGSYC